MKALIHVCAGEDLQLALDTAPEGAVLHLEKGVYRRKAIITTPGVTLEGEGCGSTRIVWSDSANTPHLDGKPTNTFRSYTLAAAAPGLRMQGLSVENDAGLPGINGQQVALSVLGDDFVMEDCELRSTQDTLFCGPLPPDLILRYNALLHNALLQAGPMRQRYVNCTIAGTVDFIFGCGSAVFERCRIHSLYESRGKGYCAAPAHPLRESLGFVFDHCCFTRDKAVPDESVYLARPWRDYGMASFIECRYDTHICHAGFDPWGNSQRDRTARFYESPAIPGRVPWAKVCPGEYAR